MGFARTSIGDVGRPYARRNSAHLNVERGRVKLGGAIFIELDNLLTKTLRDVIFGSVTAVLAKKLKPILDALDEAIKNAGGLKRFIGRFLYVDPKTGQILYWLPEVEITEKEPTSVPR